MKIGQFSLKDIAIIAVVAIVVIIGIGYYQKNKSKLPVVA